MFSKQLDFQASSKVSSSRKYDKNEASTKSKAFFEFLQTSLWLIRYHFLSKLKFIFSMSSPPPDLPTVICLLMIVNYNCFWQTKWFSIKAGVYGEKKLPFSIIQDSIINHHQKFSNSRKIYHEWIMSLWSTFFLWPSSGQCRKLGEKNGRLIATKSGREKLIKKWSMKRTFQRKILCVKRKMTLFQKTQKREKPIW